MNDSNDHNDGPASTLEDVRATTESIIEALGFQPEMASLRASILAWVDEAEDEVRPMLAHQFQAASKYFRPLTIFSCHRALSGAAVSTTLVELAQVLEMFHNVSLIVDDIVDESTHRRGVPTLHCAFGQLPALMVSGYIVADGYKIVARHTHRDADQSRYIIGLFSELMKRLGVAECRQWRLRRQPLGVADWEEIAQEDTGSMFEVCACLGGAGEQLRRFGRYLGMLYHGCDDVGDVKGLAALGGGGAEDLRDGILTLPAALAIRHDDVRALFCQTNPTSAQLEELAQAYQAQIPAAEAHLDDLAERARQQARNCAYDAESLLRLVDYTRQLSTR